MRFQRSCRGFLQRWLAEAGSFALALRRNGVLVCATARWPRLARRIGSRPGNYWMRRLLRGMLAAIWLSPPSSAPALRMLRGSPQSWQPADGRASSCPLEGSQLCLSIARDRCAYVFRSLAIAAPMSFDRSRSLRLCLSIAPDAYKEVCREVCKMRPCRKVVQEKPDRQLLCLFHTR
jgi:hypothetical protein